MIRYWKYLFSALTIVVFTQTAVVSGAPDDTASKASPHAPKASFFLIGGAADSTLSDFVRLAGGDKANIAIITLASSNAAEAGDSMQNSFEALGVKHSTVILPGSKVGLPKDCNAIYLCGGDQARLKRLLEEPLLGQIASFEGVIGGSSAGAMIAAPKMIARGMDGGAVRADQLQIIEGLNFLPGCVVDTHCGQRSRDTRSLAALALLPDAQLSIAMDEDTAIFIKDGKAHVYGAGHVRLFRRGEGFSSNIKETKRGRVANVKNAIISVLCEGDEFDLPAVKQAAAGNGKAAAGEDKSGSRGK